ncbi:DNA adenine methylase [Mycoplasmatota bacterium]|nr:DNA adenine methylase [Mycoplasmatota bacterium]
MKKDYDIKPFLKWVGGKRQLINEIEKRIPHKYNAYFEPFVGGGALFMHLQNNLTTINDFSSELIDAYKAIKDDPTQLMVLLDEHEENHSKNPKDYYYSIREMDRLESWNKHDVYVKTARLIYLNKTCFNGLYRVNKKGQFNVPFNGKVKIRTYERKNLLSLSEFLQHHTNILCGDFEDACKEAKEGDFIFFDPPYDLLKSDTFESYTKEGFGVEGQKRLARLAHELKDRGCFVMITNHNTPLINKLYKDFSIDVVQAKRMINSDASNRVGVETIICGY